MSLFGHKEQKELEAYKEVASRDKRFEFQVRDVKKIKNQEALIAAFIAVSIVSFIVYILTS